MSIRQHKGWKIYAVLREKKKKKKRKADNMYAQYIQLFLKSQCSPSLTIDHTHHIHSHRENFGKRKPGKENSEGDSE